MDNERIKVVYAWIGPRGPIWNTELPNVLSFANVAEGGATNSTMWWADDLWNRVFSKNKHLFELYPAEAIEINDERPYVYPYSLCWRINFENYFVGGTGILEFSHIPGHIRQLVRTGNGHIIIDMSVEAFMNPQHIRTITSYFRDSCHLPLNKIIYLTGAMNAKKLYHDYCEQNKVPNDDSNRINIIQYPSSQSVYAGQIERKELTEPTYDTEKIPEKLFLMWNRRFRGHRSVLALGLFKMGVLDNSLVSFCLKDPETQENSFPAILDYNELEYYNITRDDVNEFCKKLPLVLDGETNIVNMCEDRDFSTRPYYQNSLVSIITETNFNLPEVTLTEKSFKPIKEKHPFIIAGVPGAIQSMRDLGYKTFSDFWAEDYDTIEDPRVRMKRILNICNEISKWTNEQKVEFKRKVKPILEHNWQLLKKPAYQFAVEQLVNIVKTNVEKRKLMNNK